MTRWIQFSMITLFLLLFPSGGAWALSLPLGANITISDNNVGSSNSWYADHEDQEVEPGMDPNQKWDLEGFYINDNTLTVVGGYDFKNGIGGYTSGDIFIDVDGDARYGDIHNENTANREVQDTYGYDYVLDLDFDTETDTYTFDVYELDENSSVLTAYYSENQGSNPWKYDDGGTLISGGNPLTFSMNLSDDDVGLKGGLHYALQLDIGFLLNTIVSNEILFHYTMECGNDNLVGQISHHSPEPATMFLLGTGLIGLAGIGRRKISG